MENCEHESEHHLRVARAKEKMPTEEVIGEIGGLFKVMCEPSRLKILLALLEGEMCVYHIVEAVGGMQSAVSHQLRILRDGKLIKAKRDGQNVVYSIADEHVEALLQVAFEHINCEV